jgi:hypothetical protein
MAWSTVTAEHVLEEFTGEERQAVTNAQDAVENLDSILGRAVDMARDMIRAGGQSLGDAGTLPGQVAPDVIAIARWRWLISVPKLRALATDHRKAAHDDGMRRLEAIAKGELAVVGADDEDTDNIGGNWGGQQRLNMRTHRETEDN